MPSKLLILHGGAKSFCYVVSCVPENMFQGDFLRFGVLKIKSIIAKLSQVKKNKGVAG